MKNCLVALVTGIMMIGKVAAQTQGDGGLPHAPIAGLNTAPVQVFAKPDLKKLRAEDAVNDSKGNAPWRFGFNYEVNYTLENSGSWENLSDGGRVWLLAIQCQDAQTINLALKNVSIPTGNELYVYDPERKWVLGKFTEKHLYQGQLGTELIPGDQLVLEYYVAPENLGVPVSMEVAQVTHGYRGIEEFVQKSFGDAGACQMNVNCADGTPWSDQKRSTVMLVNSGGNGFCTGALVNNTENDGKPYVLTANHCYSNPANWVIRFNWESVDCSNPSSAPAFSSLSGAELRARRLGSDFCLVEITGGLESGTVPSAFNAFFAGWDNTGIAPDSSVCIHHPRGDIKKISFDDAAAVATQSVISGVTSDPEGVWMVEWDRNTATEPASSGSPLFNQDHRIIGQLWGGASGCSNLTGTDFYGRFYTSWEPAGSDQTNQLKYWLDPNDVGAIIIDGMDPALPLVQTDATLIAPQGVSGTLCTTTVEPKVTLVNLGQLTMTAASIQYGLDGSLTENFNWSGTLAPYESMEVTLPSFTTTGGQHAFSAEITTVNGSADDVLTNNLAAGNFVVMDAPQTVTLNLNIDCYGTETSWELKNGSGQILYNSPQYQDDTEGLYTYDFCLNEDCYTFVLKDVYGDGMSGCGSGNGSFQILDGSLNVLAELLQADADFGNEHTSAVCLGDAGLDELGGAVVSVYPNPFEETITIASSSVINEVELLDITGNRIARMPVGASQRKMHLGSLADGVYFLKVYDLNGRHVTQKVVKK